MKKLIVFFVLVGACSLSLAGKYDLKLYGFGSSYCIDWNRAMERNSEPDKFLATWVYGYMTARTTEINKATIQEINQTMTTVCKENPTYLILKASATAAGILKDN